MERVESHKNYIHSKQTTALSSLLPTMIDWIDETMKLITWNSQTVNDDDDNNNYQSYNNASYY